MKFNVKVSLFVIAILIIGTECDIDKPREKRTIHLFLQQFIDAFGNKPEPKVAKTTDPTGFKFNFFIRPFAKLSQSPAEDPKEFIPIPFPPSTPLPNGPSKVTLPYIQAIQITPSVLAIMSSTMPPPPMAPTMPPTMAPTMPPTMAPTIPPTMAPTMPPTMAPTMPPTMAPTMPPTMAPTMPSKIPSMSTMQPMSAEMSPMQPIIQSKVFMVDMSSTDATPTMMPQMVATSQPLMSFDQKTNVGRNFNNFGQQYNEYDSDYPQYWGNNVYQPETYQSFQYYPSSDYNNNFAEPYKAVTYLPPYENQAMYQQSHPQQTLRQQTLRQQTLPQPTLPQPTLSQQTLQQQKFSQHMLPQQPLPQEPQYKEPSIMNSPKKDGSGSSHSSVKMPGSDFNYFTYHHDSDYGQDYSAFDHQPSYQFYGKQSVN